MHERLATRGQETGRWGARLCPFWVRWRLSLSQRWLFSWVGTGLRHSPAEVEKMELIYLQEQIKINLSPFFLCILKGVHAPSQLCRAGPHWGSCEGCWEIGCCLYFPSARAIKGEGAVPSPATALRAHTGSWRCRLPLPWAPLPLPPRSPTPSPPGSLAFV